MKMRMKRITGLLLALFMTMGCLSLNSTVSYANDTDPNTFNINKGNVNITKSGAYTINGTGQATPNTISVTGSNIKATITLNNVNIDASNQTYNAAFCAKSYDQSNVHLTIILQGTNSLKSGSSLAGLKWGNSDNNSTLEIKGDGSLTATGGQNGAGIGGGSQGSGENIKITGGTVTATGGAAGGLPDGAAGIGGGSQGSGKNIKITGGSVKVNRFGAIPTDGKGNSVYLAKLENQDGVNEVTVDGGTDNKKTFKRAGSHPGSDTAFYLYLTGQDHDLVTSKGTYNAKWNSTTNAFTIIKFDPEHVEKMVVKEQPKKLSYTERENLDLTGLVVTLTDNQGVEIDVPFADFDRYKITANPENDTPLTVVNNNKPVTLTKTGLQATADTKPLTVKAKYKVTYTDGADGKAFGDQVKSVVTGDDTPGFTGTPTRDGYVFAGWSPQVADTVTKDAIYVAQWKKDHFTVTFKDGDKTQTVKVKNGKAIDTDELIDQSMPKNPTKAGYTFKEWNTKEDGKGEKFTGESVVNGDMTVYAIYTKDSVPTLSPLPDGDGAGSGMNDNAPTTVDKDELNIQIDSAESDYKHGNAGYTAVKQAADALGDALAQAKRVASNPNATQAQVDAATRKLADARKSQSEAPAPKSQHEKRIGMVPTAPTPNPAAPKSQPETPDPKSQPETPSPKSQPEKRIGMIPKKGESALLVGLIAVLGFSIAGLAILLRRK